LTDQIFDIYINAVELIALVIEVHVRGYLIHKM